MDPVQLVYIPLRVLVQEVNRPETSHLKVYSTTGDHLSNRVIYRNNTYWSCHICTEYHVFGKHTRGRKFDFLRNGVSGVRVRVLVYFKKCNLFPIMLFTKQYIFRYTLLTKSHVACWMYRKVMCCGSKRVLGFLFQRQRFWSPCRNNSLSSPTSQNIKVLNAMSLACFETS